MQYLPVSQSLPRFFFDIELEEVTYRLEFEFNDRSRIWYMNIRDSEANPIVMGLTVTIGSDILAPYHHKSCPPGALIAYDSTGKDLDGNVEDLGERIQLVYFDSTEL
jgi:hypothetical protein